MIIEIRLYASLRKYSEQVSGVLNAEVPEGTSAQDVIEMLGIDSNEIKMIMVNGKNAENDAMLNEGDRIGLFPPVGGG